MISESGLFQPITILSCQIKTGQFTYCLSFNGEILETDQINSPKLHSKVWTMWLSLQKKYGNVKLVGQHVFPDLTRFFRECASQDRKNQFKGPTPIHDLSALIDSSDQNDTPLAINEIFYKLYSGKLQKKVIEKRTVISIDVESWGLYGRPFWIAYALMVDNCIRKTGYFLCNPQTAFNYDVTESDKIWVERHVLPYATNCRRTHKSPEDIIDALGTLLKQHPDSIIIGKRVFPIETNVIFESLKRTKIKVPATILDIQSQIEIAGISEKKFPRRFNERPMHNPLRDALYAARLFKAAQ